MSENIDLLKIKDKIELLKIEKAKKEGTLENLMKELQEKFNIKTINLASKTLEDLKKEIDVKETSLDEKIQEFVTRFPGLF
jgi:CO dehydrogenase/acetyl-CoA synthase epsilon subunit